MTIFASVILGIAICLTLALALVHCLAAAGLLPFRQRSEATTNGLQALATGRGQGRDFSQLVELGFEPAGIYHESIMLVGGRDQEIVLVHPDFPVTVYLNQHSSDTISVQLISHDSQGRFIVSTDNDYLELACDTRALCFQTRWFERMEDILRDHVLALEVWEADGFEAIQVRNLEQVIEQRRSYFFHRQVQEKTKSVLFLAAVGGIILGIIVPQLIGFGLYAIFENNAGIVGAISLLVSLGSFCISAWMIRSITRSPNPKKWKRPSPPTKPQPEKSLPKNVSYIRQVAESIS